MICTVCLTDPSSSLDSDQGYSTNRLAPILCCFYFRPFPYPHPVSFHPVQQRISSNPSLQIPVLRIQPIHKLHTLLIHGEHNTATQHQPSQPRHGPAPERQDALVLEDQRGAPQAVPVDVAGLDALHAGLDGVEGLGGEDGDGAGDAADAERGHGAELLPGRRVRRLGQLLEAGVAPEADGAVGRLPHGRGHQALEEPAQAPLPRDDGYRVEEPPHPRVRLLALVDERRLDGLGRRHREQGLGDARAEPR